MCMCVYICVVEVYISADVCISCFKDWFDSASKKRLGLSLLLRYFSDQILSSH